MAPRSVSEFYIVEYKFLNLNIKFVLFFIYILNPFEDKQTQQKTDASNTIHNKLTNYCFININLKKNQTSNNSKNKNLKRKVQTIQNLISIISS